MGVPRQRVQRGSLWTGVVLLTLTCGVRANGEEELSALLSPSEFQPQESALSTLFRDWRQMMALQQLQQQMQPPEHTMRMDKRALSEHVPLVYNLAEASRDENKRAASSYMALCHFKICSVGRKRSNTRLFASYLK